MFYANFVLAKKGPLAKIWLAAHWEKKLSKAHVFETDLQSSVESIISTKVKIALRTSGHLLLGVVRIYSRKAKYLLADCTEALIKIKMAFRPGAVDLPEENREASAAAITLPEFQEWDAIVSDLNNFDIYAQSTLNQCRIEEITLKEDLLSTNFLVDDDMFGDTSFGETIEKEMLRDDGLANESILPPSETSKITIEENYKQMSNGKSLALDEPLQDDGFGGDGMDFLDGFGAGIDVMEEPNDLPKDESDVPDISLDPLEITLPTKVTEHPIAPVEDNNAGVEVPDIGNDTTLIRNDLEEFALEPIEIDIGQNKKRRRKRKLIVDDDKILSGDFIRKQIADISDVIQEPTYAPATKLRMLLDERSSIKSLFSSPAVSLHCPRLLDAFSKNLTKELIQDRHAICPSPIDLNEDMEIPRNDNEDMEIPLDDLPDNTTLGVETNEPMAPEFGDGLEDMIPTDHIDDALRYDDTRVEQMPDLSSAEKEDLYTPDDYASDSDNVEEKRWTKRTHQTLIALKREFDRESTVSFKQFSRKSNRKQAAYKFYTCLILNKENAIIAKQSSTYDDILIERGNMFGELCK